MEAKRHEAEGNNAQHNSAERLGQQEHKRSAEALGLSRVVMNAGLDDKPTHDQEDHASGEHAEPAEPNNESASGRAHLCALQVVLEGGPISLKKLPDGDPDHDEAKENG